MLEFHEPEWGDLTEHSWQSVETQKFPALYGELNLDTPQCIIHNIS